MSLLKKLRKYHANQIIRLRCIGLIKGELLNLYRRKGEYHECTLLPIEKKLASDFYKKYYGKNIPLTWHRLYKSYTGNFDEKFFPEILFSSKLEEVLNPHSIAYHLENKAFIPQQLFSNLNDSWRIKVPEMIFMDCDGVKWNKDGQILSNSSAIELLRDIGEVIIKPTVDTMGGNGVRLLNISNGVDTLSKQCSDSIISSYKKNYIIQHRVINHESIAKIYDKSINTLRVITFICDDKINIAPLVMRIGLSNRVVDNDGIFIGVNENGLLNKIGFSKIGCKKYYEHPDTKIKFDGYYVAGIKERIEAAKRLHAMIPQLKMLSWDMAYDKDGNVVIIEVNTTGQSVWFPQMVTGKSIFGEHTSDMLKLISKKI